MSGVRQGVVAAIVAASALMGCSANPPVVRGQPTAASSAPATRTPLTASPAPTAAVNRRVIAFDDGSRTLVDLDPETFAASGRARLRLGDWPTSQVLSPDGNTIALGTVSDGTIITFDPATFTLTEVVHVLHERPAANAELRLLGWPRTHLLLGLAQGFTVHVLRPGRLLLIDPANGQVRRQIALDGSAVAWAVAPNGTAVVLVGGLRSTRHARLVTVDPLGKVRSVALPLVPAGWHTEADQEWPGLAVHGRTAYVVGEGEAVTTVDLVGLTVETHRVAGLMAEQILPLEPAFPPGSGGVFRSIRRDATWINSHQMLVTGRDTFPADGQTRNQGVLHPAMIVDTRTWSIVQTFHGAAQVEPASDGERFVAWTTSYAGGRESDGLAGITPAGRTLWRRRLGGGYANLYDGRLIVSHIGGTRSQELDVRTGKPRRAVGRWKHAYLLLWSRHGGLRVTPART